MSWFYAAQGESKGPVTDHDIESLIAAGAILPATLVWKEGFATWIPFHQARTTVTDAPAASRHGVLCDSCLGFFDPTQLVGIRGRRVCGPCKTIVLARFQQDGILPEPLDPRRTGPAWEQHEKLGWYTAARLTVRAVLLEPSSTFATMRRTGGKTRPFWFGTIVGGLSNAILMIYLSIGQFAQPSLVTALVGKKELSTGPMFLAASVLRIFLGFVLGAVALFFNSYLLHLGLKLCGGGRRPFETTFRAYTYGSSAVAVLNFIPLIGTIVAIPWSAATLCIALARAHETERWRAVVAVLLPFVLLLVVIAMLVGLYAAVRMRQL